MAGAAAPQHANGRGQPVTLAPLRLPEQGPLSGWPQDDPGRSRTAANDPERWRHAVSAHRGWLAAVPVVLVNAVAFAGQMAFLRTHLPWPLPGQVLVAVTLESVAVYLAWQAHLALSADDSALRLRLAAYAFAAVIGAMNYSHYMAAHWQPTFAAATFGLMSCSSPWLWSVHSRRVSRDALKASDQLEPHAVRLGMTRWAWHPVLSYRVMRLATWEGENRPKAAIALLPPAGRRGDSGHDSPPRAAVAHDDAMGDSTRKPARKPAPRPAMTKQARAAAVIRGNPGLANAALAKLADVDVRTIQRARNGNPGSTA